MPPDHGLAIIDNENEQIQNCWRRRKCGAFNGTFNLVSLTLSLIDPDWFCAAKCDKKQDRQITTGSGLRTQRKFSAPNNATKMTRL